MTALAPARGVFSVGNVEDIPAEVYNDPELLTVSHFFPCGKQVCQVAAETSPKVWEAAQPMISKVQMTSQVLKFVTLLAVLMYVADTYCQRKARNAVHFQLDQCKQIIQETFEHIVAFLQSVTPENAHLQPRQDVKDLLARISNALTACKQINEICLEAEKQLDNKTLTVCNYKVPAIAQVVVASVAGVVCLASAWCYPAARFPLAVVGVAGVAHAFDLHHAHKNVQYAQELVHWSSNMFSVNNALRNVLKPLPEGKGLTPQRIQANRIDLNNIRDTLNKANNIII